MSDSKKSLSVSEVTIDRILSHYLWNTSVPPRRENMQSAITNANRTSVEIDAVDYMKNGAGKYASAADFKMFEKFFNEKLPAKVQPYSFDEIGNQIYGKKDLKKLKLLCLTLEQVKVSPSLSPNTA